MLRLSSLAKRGTCSRPSVVLDGGNGASRGGLSLRMRQRRRFASALREATSLRRRLEPLLQSDRNLLGSCNRGGGGSSTAPRRDTQLMRRGLPSNAPRGTTLLTTTRYATRPCAHATMRALPQRCEAERTCRAHAAYTLCIIGVSDARGSRARDSGVIVMWVGSRR